MLGMELQSSVSENISALINKVDVEDDNLDDGSRDILRNARL
jgi:hypothetical protein